MHRRRIEICGGIAAGKTTLAALFQNSELVVIFEDYANNPFWEQFYSHPRRYVFETEIGFLIQHYSLIKDAVGTGSLPVSDFSPLQDLAYADANLCSSRWSAFEALYRQVAAELGEPTVLVHLVCSPGEELQRIRRRNRGVETSIEISYLNELNDAISTRVAQVRSKVRTVTIDSEANDFAHDQKTQAEMRGLILATLNEGRRA